jgi:outer membrane receptor protein involved in Fe transport
MRSRCYTRVSITLFILPLALVSKGVIGEEAEVLEEIEVIGVTPVHGVGIPGEQIPANVQSATSKDISRFQGLDLTDFMNRSLQNVILNQAQGNPLQPDLQYRAFTASPLLGLPQGIPIYQNGIRLNEVLGDTMNWDLIPQSAIGSINLLSGANPLYGLNALGGALSIQMKNGFTHPGTRAQVQGGSFGRIMPWAESGANNGTFGYYANVSYFGEERWRDASPSNAFNLYGTLGWHPKRGSLDLSLALGDSRLVGNGPAPIELLSLDRAALFTSPDITKNNMWLTNLEGAYWWNEKSQLTGNFFYRSNRPISFNGDATSYEKCKFSEGEVLVRQIEDFTCNGTQSLTDPALAEVVKEGVVFDQHDDPLFVEAFEEAFGGEPNAINNRSQTAPQYSFGGNLQNTFLHDLFGRGNQLILGASYYQGSVRFNSTVEVARLLNLTTFRNTNNTHIFVPEDGSQVRADTYTASVYFTDTFALTPRLSLTVSGRYNHTRVGLSDLFGANPALEGSHNFDRFNPAVGITWQFHPKVNAYAGYSESSRAPTAIELACSDPDFACRLPNAFLADPPLEQVVARSFEAGLRGRLLGRINWNVGTFYTRNEDDIVFQSADGVLGNIGFFDNVGDTQRVGIEAGISGTYGLVNWFVNYGFVRATFEDSFIESSSNHPHASPEGTIRVNKGNRIPGIPEHSLKAGTSVAITPRLNVGADLVFNSDQFLRGDEANLLPTIESYTVMNLTGSYTINKHLTVLARIQNLFDTDYETFGLLGDPSEVFNEGNGLPSFTDPRFLSPGAPIGGWVGLRLNL